MASLHPSQIASKRGKMIRIERSGTSIKIYPLGTTSESATAKSFANLAAALTFFNDFPEITPGEIQEGFEQVDGASIFLAIDDSIDRFKILEEDPTHFDDFPTTPTEGLINTVFGGSLPSWKVYMLTRGRAVVAPMASLTITKKAIIDAYYTLFTSYPVDTQEYKLMSDRGYINEDSAFMLDDYSNPTYWNTTLTAAVDMTCSSVTLINGDGVVSNERHISTITITTTNDFDPDDTALTLPVIKCQATIDSVVYQFYAYRTSETAMNILYLVPENRDFLNALRDTYGTIIANQYEVSAGDITGNFAITILEY